MKSQNFELLRECRPALAELGGFAETYVYADPASALVKLRSFAENLTKDIYHAKRLPRPEQSNFLDLLNNAAFKAITPRVILTKLHALRTYGNKAAHGEPVTKNNAHWLLQEAFDLARWFLVQYQGGEVRNLPEFKKPPSEVQHDATTVLKREKRQLAEKLAVQEAQLQALLQELETIRKTTVASAEPDVPVVDAAELLEFDEATTRDRIIDALLAGAGWILDGVAGADVDKEVKVQYQPTPSGLGYADYVLWGDDGGPLAVIEAKKTSVDPERGRKQAQLYADGIEKMHGKRPVIFYTNGYDIWLWDDAADYPPRKIHGYYSKDSLQYLADFQRHNRKPLNSLEPNSEIVERLYQLEAIKRVLERFTAKHRKALIVQATGTGKTRVAIALAELLIRAGWAKRVLFLCDRRELRKQAKNAFNDYLSEPIRIINSRVDRQAPERIFLATYPAMQNVYQSFDVGFFDLIIADESHRSIYNVYGDMFHYFDCLQLGLTATPVDFVTRSTFKLFSCEGQLPTANYDLETAVKENWLVPFEVYEYTTQFLREGIKLDILTKDQIEELEEQGEDTSQYDFPSEQLDKIIYNKDTNRAILRNLMERGLRDEAGHLPGKSIIFARNHHHAVLLRQVFDEMYPQYGGSVCQVIDNYDPRAEQLIDDFKGEGTNPDLTVAISVDMLDTGIDIPEILNLVFAKPVKSPVKFWQMIGRGTRLCEDLFGPGRNKTVFRIFDHLRNFERFETSYQPATPRLEKSLAQSVFEERLLLAELALQKSEVKVFETVVDLIKQDILALPEESVAVREKWRAKRALSADAVLKEFAPETLVKLRQDIAPLMQWRNIRGWLDAYTLDSLIARIQTAVLQQSGAVHDLKINLMDYLASLKMHLQPVREKAEVIKRVKSDEFWNNVTVPELEGVRKSLREIMHHRARRTSQPLPPKVIDVSESDAEVQYRRRPTNLNSVDMKAYQQIIEAELKRHFDSNPTLQKIRAGIPVSEADIQALVSLVLVQSPNASKEVLQHFFVETAAPLEFAIRSIIGLDPEAVASRFAAFAQKHPALTAKQTRFLNLLQNHIARFGSITLDHLYEQPFTVVDINGLDGVFSKPEEIDDLLDILDGFVPPEPTVKGQKTEENRRQQP